MSRQAARSVIAFLAVAFADASLAADELAIVVSIPQSITPTDRYYDVCGDTPCLAHGYDIVLVEAEVTEVLFGTLQPGRVSVLATDGFLRHNNRPTRENKHLFVLRRSPSEANDAIEYVVAEADPIVGQACTVFSIEDYLSDAVWMSLDAPFAEADHCYTLESLRELIGASDRARD